MRPSKRSKNSAGSSGGDAAVPLVMKSTSRKVRASIRAKDQTEHGTKPGKIDPSFASSRCPVRLIHEVVSKFGVEKQRLVESIGFEGILHFPPMKQINRRFSLFLMNSVDENSLSITFHGQPIVKFSKSDVGLVFGITTSGRRVLCARSSCRDAKEKVINDYLGSQFKEQHSIKHLQEILSRDYTRPMSPSEQDAFKVAFVVFVTSTLLAPSSKHDYASVDYWNVLEEPSAIGDYDWSEFVITKLIEACTKLKA